MIQHPMSEASSSMSPLHAEATSGDLALLEDELRASSQADMLAKQINLPHGGWRDWTPLHYAAANDHCAAARALLAAPRRLRGARPDRTGLVTAA